RAGEARLLLVVRASRFLPGDGRFVLFVARRRGRNRHKVVARGAARFLARGGAGNPHLRAARRTGEKERHGRISTLGNSAAIDPSSGEGGEHRECRATVLRVENEDTNTDLRTEDHGNGFFSNSASSFSNSGRSRSRRSSGNCRSCSKSR